MMYRIRRRDGTYSTGGTTPSFTKKGKVWKELGHLKNHLRQFDGRYNPPNPYVHTDEVVCMEVRVVDEIPINKFIDEEMNNHVS